MRYLGGKSKIAKRLTQCILANTDKRDILIEPFIGGGAMTAALAPHFTEVRCYDSHEDLILMWNELAQGWKPPTYISEDLYKELKTSRPSALRAFAGFGGASWGGKWFGGYARGGMRNYADESARSLSRDIAKMTNCSFVRMDYRNIEICPGAVIYCDPPYAETTEYKDSFNSVEFWGIVGNWASMGAKVFVSEYKAPAPWKEIWGLERTRDMKSNLTNAVRVTEKLFTLGE